MSQDGFKIRTLPRSSEPKASPPSPARSAKSIWKLLIGGALALALVALWQLTETKPEPARAKQAPQAFVLPNPSEDRVNRHLQELAAKKEMNAMAIKLENDQFISEAGSRPAEEVWDQPKDRVYGLQLDQEDAAEKVYQDLHHNKSEYSEMLPEDRINARLANAKWIAEMEREEQKQFIANFIRQAREAGYEITLNDQLVVVKVVKVSGNRKVSIDKILDQLARRPASP